jgi:hypothetical protein
VLSSESIEVLLDLVDVRICHLQNAYQVSRDRDDRDAVTQLSHARRELVLLSRRPVPPSPQMSRRPMLMART